MSAAATKYTDIEQAAENSGFPARPTCRQQADWAHDQSIAVTDLKNLAIYQSKLVEWTATIKEESMSKATLKSEMEWVATMIDNVSHHVAVPATQLTSEPSQQTAYRVALSNPAPGI